MKLAAWGSNVSSAGKAADRVPSIGIGKGFLPSFLSRDSKSFRASSTPSLASVSFEDADDQIEEYDPSEQNSNARNCRSSLDLCAVETGRSLKKAAFSPHGHWKSEEGFENFVQAEMSLRTVNRRAAQLRSRFEKGTSGLADAVVNYDLFVSHCWRNGTYQEVKRRLISEMSRVNPEDSSPGLTYWADFLDLVAQGPVSWRQEIEEGIYNAAKFVAFIDLDYLLSFNCFMELALAFYKGKPVLPIVIDNEAWELLVHPSAGKEAWDRSEDFRKYKGFRMPGGLSKFSEDMVEEVFSKIQRVNFCPCRPSDISTLGMESIVFTMRTYVNKDITYLKEHAELSRKARQWVSKGRPKNTGLIVGQEISQWKDWHSNAVSFDRVPEPTPLQIEYLKASSTRSNKRIWAMRSLVILLMTCILAGSIMSGIMAVRANAAATAARQEKFAVLSWSLISAAEAGGIQAVETGSEDAVGDSYVALKAIRQALRIMPFANRPELAYRALDAFRDLLMFSYHSPSIVCIGKLSANLYMRTDTSGSGLMISVNRTDMSAQLWDTSQYMTETEVASSIDSDVSKGAFGLQLDGMKVSGAATSWGGPETGTLATGDGSGNITLWTRHNKLGFKAVASRPVMQKAVFSVDISPDGKMVASTPLSFSPVGQGIYLWHLSRDLAKAWKQSEGGSSTAWEDNTALGKVQLLKGHMSWITAVRWRPKGGTAIASTSADRTVRLWEPENSTEGSEGPPSWISTTLLEGIRPQSSPFWHPDGTFVAIINDAGDAVVIDMQTLQPSMVKRAGRISVNFKYPIFGQWMRGPKHPLVPMGGGLWITNTMDESNSAVMWNADPDTAVDGVVGTRMPQRIIDKGEGICSLIEVSPDGLWIASSFFGGEVRLLRVAGLDGSSEAKTESVTVFSADLSDALATAEEKVLGLRWTADGVTFIATNASSQMESYNGNNGPKQFGTGSYGNPDESEGEKGPLETRLYTLDFGGELTYEVVAEPGPALVMNSHGWSQDGSKLAFFYTDNIQLMHVWTLESSEGGNTTVIDVQSFPVETDQPMVHIVFSPSGEYIVISSLNLIVDKGVEVFLFNTVSGTTQQLDRAGDFASRPTWSPDGRRLLTQLDVWIVSPGIPMAVKEQTLETDGLIIRSSAWHPNSRRLTLGFVSGECQTWEDPILGSADIALHENLEGNGSPVYTVTLSPEGAFVYFGMRDGTVAVMRSLGHGGTSVDLDQTRSMLIRGHTGEVMNAKPLISRTVSGALRPLVVSASLDMTTRIWDPSAESYSGLKRLYGHTSWIYCLAYSPSGTFLASGSKDGTVRLWRVPSRNQPGKSLEDVIESPTSEDTVLRVGDSWIQTLAWSPTSTDSAWQLAVGVADGAVVVYSWTDEAGVQSSMHKHDGPVTSLVWAFDGSVLASGSSDSTVGLWYADDLDFIILEGHDDAVTDLAFSPTGQRLASASRDGNVMLWKLLGMASKEAGVPREVLTGHSGPVTGVLFSRDGRWLVSGSDDATARLYDITAERDNGIPVLETVIVGEDAEGLTSIALSIDSQILATGNKAGQVSIYKLSKLRGVGHTIDGEKKDVLPEAVLLAHISQVRSLEFSTSGKWLASSGGGRSDDGFVRMWDITDPTKPYAQNLRGHANSRIASTAIAPDSQSVAFSGGVGYLVHVVHLMDPETAVSRLDTLMWGNTTLSESELLQLKLPKEVLQV